MKRFFALFLVIALALPPGLIAPLAVAQSATNRGVFFNAGAWSSTPTYAVNDVVTYGGQTYYSLVAGNHANTPSSSPSSWYLFSTPGATGTNGSNGSNGANGIVNMRGAYSSGTTYALGDGVTDGTGTAATTYVSIQAANVGHATSNTAWWTPLAQAPGTLANTLGQANGPAGLDGSGYLNANQIPTGLSTANVIAEYNMLDTGTHTDLTGHGHTATDCASAPTLVAGVGLAFLGGGTQCFQLTDSLSWASTIKHIQIVYNQTIGGASATKTPPIVASPVSGHYACFICGAGSALTGTFTVASGGTGGTTGTQTVTFIGGLLSVAGATAATGTVSVSVGVPTGPITITSFGSGYGSLPTSVQVATVTGTTTVTGGSLYIAPAIWASQNDSTGANWLYPGTKSGASGAGTHVADIWTDGTLSHIAIDGQEGGYFSQSNDLATLVGSLGGAPYNIGYSPSFPSQHNFQGTIYYLRLFSGIPTAAQIAQDASALKAIVSRRGVSFGSFNPTTLSVATCSGDSKIYGQGSSTPPCDSYLNTFISTPYSSIYTFGISGFAAQTLAQYPIGRECLLSAPLAVRNDGYIWDGTNDIWIGGLANAATTWGYIKSQIAALRGCPNGGFKKAFILSDIDRGGQSQSVGSASSTGGVLDSSTTLGSGGTSCTNGTQAVTSFNGGGVSAAGTVTVTGGIPVPSSFVLTASGANFTSVPTTAQVATCTGTTTVNGQMAEVVLNRLERKEIPTMRDTYLVDVASISTLAPNGTNSGSTTYYQTDKAHLTAGGYTTIAQAMAKVANAAYGSTPADPDPVPVTTSPYNMQDGDGGKIFDTAGLAITVNMESAMVWTGHTIRVCNFPSSGAGNNVTVQVATTTPTANSTGTVTSVAIPVAEYIGQSGTTSATVAAGSCKDFTPAVQNELTGGSYWRVK